MAQHRAPSTTVWHVSSDSSENQLATHAMGHGVAVISGHDYPQVNGSDFPANYRTTFQFEEQPRQVNYQTQSGKTTFSNSEQG